MTVTRYIRVQPRDPLIARDGRPFGADSGSRMRSLDWPLPSVAAGSLRTLLGRSLGGDFNATLIAQLKNLQCRGPLPVSEGKLFVPVPNDLVIDHDDLPQSLRPCILTAGAGGTDLPAGLHPVLAARRLGKTVSPPAWWSMEKMAEWLLATIKVPDKFFAASEAARFRQAPAKDERTHLKIDPRTLASEAGLLFSTTGLVLNRLSVDRDWNDSTETSLAMTAAHDTTSSLTQAWSRLPSFQPFGGERRLALFEDDSKRGELWKCPANVKAKLEDVKQGTKLRMVLATPAIFSEGWRPGWLSDAIERIGTPPEIISGSLQLRLVAVANQRWDAVSGWSYETRGPKAIRRMVPAGGVYFFEVVSCENVNWDELWLNSVSDDAQDRRDGFGLALWGLWDERSLVLQEEQKGQL